MFWNCVGSVELAAVGVSASVFNLVSKLFNVPLLNVTTSFVAEEQAVLGNGSDQPGHTCSGDSFICAYSSIYIPILCSLMLYFTFGMTLQSTPLVWLVFVWIDGGAERKSKIILPSVSTSLALATGLGIAEAIAVSIGSSFLMNTMGIAAVCVIFPNRLFCPQLYCQDSREC